MDKARLRRIAKYQRAVCVCILLMFGTFGCSVLFNPEAFSTTYDLHWSSLLYYLINLISLVFTYLLVRNVYNPTVAALLAIFMLVPCINIFILLAASQKATKVLKAENIKVGLLGANMSQFD